ncbi:ABC-2 type transport system permease protein [Modestobacter sp. DSM 44400]|uniref:ABC transporter permease n=1 Tax=Modestobacter sp. DSM 44400 TaxID=1550230 RepID=UPI00089CBF88|nr:ABC-2 family transporter protein [Modestobacter sp. DSM 44400]SDY29778.1 ABC-2 type transport system permease protein [Modestobacter sp. DSM 44400]
MAAPSRAPRDAQALRLVATFLRMGVQTELQYRANVVFSVLQSVVAVATSLAVLGLVFSHTDALGGWSGEELLVVMGVYVLMGGVIRSVIQPNMQQLMEDVQQGTLDFVLTKPADGQLLVSARRFELWQAIDVVLGAVLVAVAVVRLDRPVSVIEVLGFLTALVLGAVTIYSFWLLLTIGAFWIVRVDSLVELFDGMYQAGRWPVSVYPGWLRIGFTFLVPLAFAITVPAEALTGRASGWLLLGAAAFTVALSVLTRVLWRVGLRHYSGASA